jgi:hypothetical protein
VWSWHPLLVSSRRRLSWPNRAATSLQSAGDGDKTNSSPGRARHKPSSHCVRGCRVISVDLYARVRTTTTYAHETAGAPCTRHPRAPFGLRGAEINGKPRATRAARSRTHVSLYPMSQRHCELFQRHCEEPLRRSNPLLLPCLLRDGLLRGACHRARVRATRWLAMTLLELCHTPSCHHPRRRVIQYSETPAIESMSRGVLDPPHARGMTIGV